PLRLGFWDGALALPLAPSSRPRTKPSSPVLGTAPTCLVRPLPPTGWPGVCSSLSCSLSGTTPGGTPSPAPRAPLSRWLDGAPELLSVQRSVAEPGLGAGVSGRGWLW